MKWNGLEITCRSDGRPYTLHLKVQSYIPDDLYQCVLHIPPTTTTSKTTTSTSNATTATSSTTTTKHNTKTTSTQKESSSSSLLTLSSSSSSTEDTFDRVLVLFQQHFYCDGSWTTSDHSTTIGSTYKYPIHGVHINGWYGWTLRFRSSTDPCRQLWW
jgi:Complex I intermediate-associated protein 30 (CIA30)